MFAEVGQVLKLIGGAAHRKVSSFIAEKFPVTKMLDGGPLGGMLKDVLANGPGALLSNPVAALTSAAQGQLSGLASQVAGALPGASGLVGALTGPGGLSSALGSLSGAADLLSGAVPAGAGQFGLMDVLGHDTIAGMLGDALPGHLGLDTVLGPLTSASAVGNAMAGAQAAVAGALSGALPIPAAIAQVTGHAATITGIVTASQTALSTVNNSAMDLVTVSSVAASLTSGPPALQAALGLIVAPDIATRMREAVATHIAEG